MSEQLPVIANYRSIAIRLAAFCCRVHGQDPGELSDDVRKEAIKLAHEFKAVESSLAKKERLGPDDAAGLQDLFDYVAAMVSENVKHKTKGFGLADMTWFDQSRHLIDEAREARLAVTALDARLELGDVLGVLVHMAHFQGMDAEDLVFTCLSKLRARFDEPTNFRGPLVPQRGGE